VLKLKTPRDRGKDRVCTTVSVGMESVHYMYSVHCKLFNSYNLFNQQWITMKNINKIY